MPRNRLTCTKKASEPRGSASKTENNKSTIWAGTTHLSAGHNVALSQVLNRSTAQYVCMNAMKFKSDFNMHITHLTQARQFQPAQNCYHAGHVQTAGTSLELKSVKEISYLSSQLNFSNLIPTLKRDEELSGLACENVRATLLLRVPSPTSTQTSQLVLIERTTQDELSATSLAPNNDENRRQFTGEVFE
ncbi:hypothetical protein F511_36220 [Dorcoceras hygrometricum]|uniref:Uncharacterized protein n=1 Tax=Dorcoceras hygrometricum TaxID=472368 RepID=A0A2Z7CFL5_9LAMI|nr:hypothetical protein F511_36220 [Dorcoceras hygrometricum]